MATTERECEDCLEVVTTRRTRCKYCGLLVCIWCYHTVQTSPTTLTAFLGADERDLQLDQGWYGPWWGRLDADVAERLRCVLCGYPGLMYHPAGDVAQGRRVALYECPACGDTTER